MAKRKFTIQPVTTTRPVEGIDREILTKSVDDGVYPLAMAKEIRIDRLRPDPDQPRRGFDQRRLEDLAASIREQGILQPIVVEYIDDGDYFRIVHGERRWRASLLAGLPALPAIVRAADEPSRLVRQLIENIQREDLNDIDRAFALRQLKVDLGSPSWDVVAQKVGISKRRVLQLMDTTKLPESVQQDIRDGHLTEKHGRAIKKLPPEQQIDFAQAIREESLSGDESLRVAKVIAATPELPFTAAIAQVKQNLPPAPTATATPAPTSSTEEPVQSLETAEPPLHGVTATGDERLAELARVPAMLDRYDLANVDALRLQNVLLQIIASAEQLLSRVLAEAAIPVDLAGSFAPGLIFGASVEDKPKDQEKDPSSTSQGQGAATAG